MTQVQLSQGGELGPPTHAQPVLILTTSTPSPPLTRGLGLQNAVKTQVQFSQGVIYGPSTYPITPCTDPPPPPPPPSRYSPPPPPSLLRRGLSQKTAVKTQVQLSQKTAVKTQEHLSQKIAVKTQEQLSQKTAVKTQVQLSQGGIYGPPTHPPDLGVQARRRVLTDSIATHVRTEDGC